MSIYYHFRRLIKKYSTTFTAKIPQSGGFVNGEYTASEKEVELTGAILDINEQLIHNSNGTLTANDKQLFIESELADNLVGVKIIHKNKVYNVEEVKENYDFTGFCAYTLKFVSAFKEGR